MARGSRRQLDDWRNRAARALATDASPVAVTWPRRLAWVGVGVGVGAAASKTRLLRRLPLRTIGRVATTPVTTTVREVGRAAASPRQESDELVDRAGAAVDAVTGLVDAFRDRRRDQH
ncbi:hypothetical protein [Egicoccus sp. AB-alg2]|uniref:hypothetical protein n=1 Tax=Egicoccus sp. AB-alg2 TaxID=3242693 RepID=UPI00359E1FCB